MLDGLPNNNYYKPTEFGWKGTKDEATFIASIRKRLPPFHDYSRNGNELSFKLQDGRNLVYYINTPTEDVIKSKFFETVMSKATIIYVAGYHPWRQGFRGKVHTPNVKIEIAREEWSLEGVGYDSDKCYMPDDGGDESTDEGTYGGIGPMVDIRCNDRVKSRIRLTNWDPSVE